MTEAGCQCTMQSHNERSYAGAAVRICAYLVDQLIVLMVIGVVAGFLGILRLLGLDVILDKEILFTYTVSAIIYYIVRKIYYIAFTYTSGQTVGKKVFRIKVVNDDMSKATFWRVVYRETIGRFLAEVYIFGFIGYFIILLDDKKRGIHDRLSDTRVVYEERVNNEPERKPYVGIVQRNQQQEAAANEQQVNEEQVMAQNEEEQFIEKSYDEVSVSEPVEEQISEEAYDETDEFVEETSDLEVPKLDGEVEIEE